MSPTTGALDFSSFRGEDDAEVVELQNHIRSVCFSGEMSLELEEALELWLAPQACVPACSFGAGLL